MGKVLTPLNSPNTSSVLIPNAVPKLQVWGVSRLNREAVSLPYKKYTVVKLISGKSRTDFKNDTILPINLTID